jgi:hypothetical protein
MDYQSSADKEVIIDAILRSLKVPTAENMASNFKIDYWYTRLSPELCEKQEFLDQIRKKFEPGLSGYYKE